MNRIPEILAWLDESPSEARSVAAAARLDRADASDLSEVRVAILRNITIEHGLHHLKIECYRSGLKPILYVGPFDNVQQDAMDSGSALYTFKPDVIVVALRLHTLVPRLIYQFMELTQEEAEGLAQEALQRVEAIVRALRSHCPALILIQNFEQAPAPANGLLDAQSPYGQQNLIRRLNLRLTERMAEVQGAYLLDIEHLAAQIGYDHALDDRTWHIGRAPYTPALQKRLAAEQMKFLRALKGKQKKCLVLDCDNTLWGGVVGEEGVHGIKLGSTHPGSAYVDFQAAILDLYHRGVLLALCSKNNHDDAMEVFVSHPDTRLKPDHFVVTRINWQDKAANLREIAAHLNLGLDSLVFVDDSEFECNLVRQALPQVTTLHLPPEPSAFRRLLQSSGLFDTLTLSDEDRRRTQMYQAQERREALKGEAGSLEDYLRSLQMVLKIERASDQSIPRIAQLTQKTNQFNLTTRRYSEGEIRQLADDPNASVLCAQLTDRFDDSGTIAVIIVRRHDCDAIIDTFLMSCRVIGRGVEQAILAHVAAEAAALGCSRLIGEFIPTAKNGQVRDFYPQQGFRPLGDPESRRWALTPAGPQPTVPDWFQEVVFLDVAGRR